MQKYLIAMGNYDTLYKTNETIFVLNELHSQQSPEIINQIISLLHKIPFKKM